ncbi:MAG TPA: ATP-binding cassette domain-containing protein [Protaetiibacter sp.]|nr:ATP-binding cassette domain-containing protein [Protaetiibacter sp.]
MIEIDGVHKRFGRKEVLRGVDLTVRRGEILALLGPNGAGKTTIVNILTTLVRPDAGTARIDGLDVVRDAREVQRRIAVTGQSSAVDGALTAEENLRMLARLSGLRGARVRTRTAELLERFDLTANARERVSGFSGGMRRRLDLALSLVVDSPVVFLDEPTTGLDTRSRQELWAIIGELAGRGTTVLLTTQYLEEADRLADRVLVLDGGRIVADGAPAALKAKVGGDVVTLLDDDEQIVREIPTDGSLAGLRRALDTLDDAHADGRVALRAPSLDDVFLALTTTPAPAQENR